MEKKITLVKREDRYDLYGEQGEKIASSAPNLFKKLSVSNCDELFDIADVEKWVKEHVDADPNLEVGTSEYQNAQVDFKAGFNKKTELDKDKVFTLEDMKKAFINPKNFDWFGELIKSIQQPNEIEVEIMMENYVKYVPKSLETIYPTGGVRPKLDENNCLILKRVV
jgi:hypothetical protein